MTPATKPVGIFDSGVGGLSVLRAMLRELPAEPFIYVSDNAHAPYGERDDAHLIARSRAVARHLVEQHHIKALVVACNTATAAAIHQLRQEYANLAIVGIEPALKPAALHSTSKRIGVMATRSTLSSEKFRALLEKLSGSAEFVLQACNGLADAIERNDNAQVETLCARYTQAMGAFGSGPGDIDTLVLGCTHYPFANATLASLVGDGVTFFEGGAPVARQTRKLLAERGQLAQAMPDSIGYGSGDGNSNSNGSGNGSIHGTPAIVRFKCTGSPDALQQALQRWLQLAVPVQSLPID